MTWQLVIGLFMFCMTGLSFISVPMAVVGWPLQSPETIWQWVLTGAATTIRDTSVVVRWRQAVFVLVLCVCLWEGAGAWPLHYFLLCIVTAGGCASAGNSLLSGHTELMLLDSSGSWGTWRPLQAIGRGGWQSCVWCDDGQGSLGVATMLPTGGNMAATHTQQHWSATVLRGKQGTLSGN